MRYTPKPISETTWELSQYTPASIDNTDFILAPDGAFLKLTAPTNQATGVSKTPTFSWEAFEPAADRRYQVLVTSDTKIVDGSTVGDFTNALQYITPNTTFTIPSADQLTGTTTYYWRVTPARAIGQSSYSEDFTTADQNGWVSPWVTETLTGNTTQEIAGNKAILRLNENALARAGARLSGITFADLDLYIRNQSFSDVSTSLEPTYHFRTQGDWRADNFIIGYFLYFAGSQVRFGRMLEGGSIPTFPAQTFNRIANTDYDIRIRADGFRLRMYIWESGTTEPATPLLDNTDANETFASGGFGIKIAGSVISNISIDSFEASFGTAVAGITVTSFSIDQADTTVSANGTRQLTITTQGENTSGGATWTSSNEAVATVDTNGLVTWVSAGTATITAISVDDNSFTDTVQITAEAVSDYVPGDSQAEDEQFLNDFYAATQGQHLEVLASTSELPDKDDPSVTTDLDQYLINGDLYFLDSTEIDRNWVNKGPVWANKTGWNNGNVDLSVHDPVGVTKEQINGEWRVTRFDMQKITFDGYYNGNEIWDGNVCAGTLPPTWGNLTKCEYFNVKQNFMVGEIPDTLQSDSDLELLYLGGQRGDISLNEFGIGDTGDHRGIGGSKEFEEQNKFEGNLPTTLPNNIYAVEVRRQYLEGGLPPEWGTKTNLKFIYLNEQKSAGFGGPLPTEWGSNGLNPRVVDISGSYGKNGLGRDPYYNGTHEFTGGIPQSWQDNWSLIVVPWFANNPLGNVMPDFVNAVDVRRFMYTGCDFTSPEGEFMFPESIFSSGGNALLTSVEFSGNELTGKLRQTITPITLPESSPHTPRDNYGTISTLDFSGFNLDGAIPEWVKDMGGLQQCRLFNNNFDPPFPVKLVEKSVMRLFSFGNALSGEPNLLPDVDFGAEIYEFNSSNNAHYGPIPASWESMAINSNRGVWRFYMSDNDLSGEFPEWLGEVRGIRTSITQGRRYRIDVYGSGDDFTGVGASSNTAGVEFTATGDLSRGPSGDWVTGNGSVISTYTLEWVYMENNRFTYCDILPHYSKIMQALEYATGVSGSRSSAPKFRVDTDKTFPVSQTEYSGTAPVTANLSEIDYANNVYQWQRLDGNDWVDVSGQTTHTLSTSTAGTYRLRITNDDLPYVNNDIRGLEESISESITITIT